MSSDSMSAADCCDPVTSISEFLSSSWSFICDEELRLVEIMVTRSLIDGLVVVALPCFASAFLS